MKIQVAMFAICCIAFACSGCATQGLPLASTTRKSAANTDMQFSVARAHEKEGRLGQASEIYEALYAADHTNSRVCHRLGVVKLRMGDIGEGTSYLMEANSINPRDPQILGDIGYAYLQDGSFDLSEKFLRESLNVDPSNERNINNLAMAVGSQGRMEEAFSLYRGVVGEAEAYANLGYLYSQRGETEMSMEYYSKALDVNPKLRTAGEAFVQMAELNQQVMVAKEQREKSDIQLASDSVKE